MLRSMPPVSTASKSPSIEPLDGGADRRHGRGAGRVDDEVGPVEVEEVGDAAGDAVGELARHACPR